MITHFQVCADDTLDTLHPKIAEKTGITTRDYYLLHMAHRLEKGKKISEYEIKKDSNIYLLFRLRGGAIPISIYGHN